MNMFRPARQVTLAQRIGLMLLMLVLIMVAVTAGNLWFSQMAERNIQYMRQAADQSAMISSLQHTWMSVVGTLDTFSVTRPTPEAKEELDRKLDDLNAQLDQLSAAGSLGMTEAIKEENRQILAELKTTFSEVEELANEIYELSSANRWGTALQRRQSGMGKLQVRLEMSLQTINNNLMLDLSQRSANIERSQRISRVFSVLAMLISITFALGMARVGQRRITIPLNNLARQVDQISQGDFSRVEPLQQKDELGDLSKALTLMTEWLRNATALQEQKILERTQALEQRNAQVQAATQVARDISASHDLKELLDNAVNLIRDRLLFYHAGIFLSDARNEFQVLRAATGDAGQKMLERGHSLRIGQTGLVGFAAESGEPRVSENVSRDAAHYKNPLLPETQSEAALPLKVAGRVIGVLDVQSREPDSFDAETLDVLQLMTDQLAIAIQNARLMDEIQNTLAETQIAFGNRERQAWQQYFQTTSNHGYSYDGIEVRPLEVQSSGHEDGNAVTIPLSVRGQEIGALEVWTQSGEVSESESYILSTIGSRLSQILESARLYEETQSRAAREETINRLTATIARSLDLDGVLRSATLELGKLPSVREVTVVLDTPIETGSLNNGGGNGHRP